MSVLPQLEVRLKDGSDGKKTVERDYLVFTKLQTYDDQTKQSADQALRDHLDDLINQLIIMRACV